MNYLAEPSMKDEGWPGAPRVFAPALPHIPKELPLKIRYQDGMESEIHAALHLHAIKEHGESMRILCVDDDRTTLTLISRSLAKTFPDDEILSAQSGEEAFVKTRAVAVDIVVTDSETCRWWISQHTGIQAKHPIEVLAESLDL